MRCGPRWDRAEAGASVWNGMLVARILGADGASVRAVVLPRWMCCGRLVRCRACGCADRMMGRPE